MSETKKEKVSSIYGIEHKITPKRMDGNTTRVIDNAIQILFNGDICVMQDHDKSGNNRKMNEYVFDRVLMRLQIEHKHIFDSGLVRYNKNRLEIYITEKP